MMEKAQECQALIIAIAKRAGGDPEEIGAAAYDYLFYSGYVVLAYWWARSVAAADASSHPQAVKDAKRETARFYYARLLPRTLAHRAAIGSGTAPLLAPDEAAFHAWRARAPASAGIHCGPAAACRPATLSTKCHRWRINSVPDGGRQSEATAGPDRGRRGSGGSGFHIRRHPQPHPAISAGPPRLGAPALARCPRPGDELDQLAGRGLSLRARSGGLDPRRSLPAHPRRHRTRHRPAQHARTASDHRRARARASAGARSHPDAHQRRAVRARPVAVHVLRQEFRPPAADPRPRGPALARRPRHLGERGLRLLPLQFAQGRAHAAAGLDAAAGHSLPAQLDRTPDPEQPQHPRRPDGVPDLAPAQAQPQAPVKRADPRPGAPAARYTRPVIHENPCACP